MLFYLAKLAKYNSFFNVFHYITVRAGIAAIISLLITFFVIPFLIKQLEKKGFFAQIRKKYFHHLHNWKKNVPMSGGIGVLFSFFISTILCAKMNQWVIITLIGVFLFGLVGFFDDWLKYKKRNSEGIKKSTKIIIEILICLFLAFLIINQNSSIEMTNVYFPFFKNLVINLGLFYIFWVILVVLGSSNSVNLTDGLDGLAVSSLIFVTFGFAIISYLSGNSILAKYLYIPYVAGSGELAIVAISATASLLGFLWYNCYPSEIFFGDVGSLSFGALVGIIALITKQELILPIIGGILVIETISVILQVINFKLKGKRIFKMTPLHHHFELLGWPEPKIVTRFQIISVILLLIGLLTLKMR